VVIIPVRNTSLARAATPLYYEAAMTRKFGCSIAALLLASALIVLIYGFHPWFRPSVTTKKLSNPNPTSFVFTASVADVHRVLKDHAVRCCGEVELKENAVFSRSILNMPGNENDAYIHNFHEPIGPSSVYFSGTNPLLYICEFHLHIVQKTATETQVTVIPQNSEVIDGQSWWGPHGPPANIYKDVKPTTIEEYKILLELGAALGTVKMPQLLLPEMDLKN
jgi:hypothetical protein